MLLYHRYLCQHSLWPVPTLSPASTQFHPQQQGSTVTKCQRNLLATALPGATGFSTVRNTDYRADGRIFYANDRPWPWTRRQSQIQNAVIGPAKRAALVPAPAAFLDNPNVTL